MHKRALGNLGEALARQYLLQNGYEIVAQNFRSTRGEIDIVAQKEQVLTFFEVKYRTDLALGHPAEAITKRKLASLRSAIAEYLSASEGAVYQQIKIEAICIVHLSGQEPEIEVFPDILGP